MTADLTEPRLRITFVCLNYPPSMGGAQRHVEALATGLATTHGHQVEVITTDADRLPSSLSAGQVAPGNTQGGRVTVHRLSYARRLHWLVRQLRRALRRVGLHRRSGNPFGNGPLGARLSFRVWRASRTQDVVVGVSLPFTTGAVPALLPLGRSAVASLPLLHWSPEHGLHPLALIALRRSDVVIANTTFEAEVLRSHGVESVVIPPGVDEGQVVSLQPEEARRLLGLPEAPTIAFVGRLAAYKGLDVIVSALPMILERHPGAALLVAAGGSPWPEFDALIARARNCLGQRLSVRLNFPEAERANLLACADVVVTPSREESFGLVNIEAWAAGRPVIAGDIPAVRSVIREGEDGLLVPTDDPVALAEAIDQLLGNSTRAQQMGERGRERVLAELTWPRVVDRWNTELLRVEGSRGPKARRLRSDRA